jgi:hypothetical protein
MTKIAICIPSGDMVHADFAMALAALTYQCGPVTVNGEKHEPLEIALLNVKASLIVYGRSELVHEAQKLGVDYLFFVDSDIVLHPWTLRQLLSRKVDIVGGTYIQRKEPHRLLGNGMDGLPLGESVAGKEVGGADLYEVSGLPAGCLLIKMSVFDHIPRPYFATPAHVHEDRAWYEGEDYFFCAAARAAGYQVWLDWPVSFALSHLGQQAFKIPGVRLESAEVKSAIIH